MFQEEHIKVFQAAARYGIKSTAHVGNTGSPEEVAAAVQVMQANRIAHGDRVIENDEIFKQMIDLGVHFENCPSVSSPPGDNNPVVRFARDGASFSISSDAPTATKATLTDVYKAVVEWGLSIKQLQQTVSAFYLVIPYLRYIS
jgi:adenosine deaminase